MKYIINFIFALAFGIVVIFQGCDDTVSSDELESIVLPDRNVSYVDVQRIFNIACNNSGCHNSIDRAGDLSLQDYGEVTSNPLIIFPGEPNSSKLVWAIEGRAGTATMPPIGGQVRLTQNHINGIKTWIAEGAQAD